MGLKLRHLRKREWRRLRHAYRLKDFAIAQAARLNASVSPHTVTAISTFNWTSAAHGISHGEGPYFVTATTTFPGGTNATTPYWAHVVDANTVRLSTTPDLKSIITPSSAGSGTITLRKGGASARGIFELLRRHRASKVQVATDIDNLN